MTTILLTPKHIAWDSRTSWGNLMMTVDQPKVSFVNGMGIAVAGNSGVADYINNEVLRGTDVADAVLAARGMIHPDEADDIEVLIFQEFPSHPFGFRTWHLNMKSPFPGEITPTVAIGSGGDFALAAFKAHCSPKQCLEIAAECDTGTGGPFYVYEVLPQLRASVKKKRTVARRK